MISYKKQLLFFTCLLSFFASWAFAGIQTIKIGVASNFSDVTPNSYNPLGNSVKNGASMATGEINKKLRARGLQVQLVPFDYGGEKLDTLRVAQETVASDVIGVIGYEFSSHALLAAPIHQLNRLPMITPSASADRISTIGDFVFQGTFNNSYQTSMLAEHAANYLNLRQTIIVLASDCAYCQDLSAAFEKAYISAGGKIIDKVFVLDDQKDFNGLIDKADFSQADAVFIPNHELNSARIISYLLDNGIKTVFLGGDGWRTLGNIHKTRHSKDFIGYMMAHWKPDLPTKLSQEFTSKYREQFTVEPTDSAALAYDSMHFIGQALAQMSVYDRSSLKSSLSSIKTFTGVTGDFIFGSNLAPNKSILLMKSSPSGFVIEKALQPRKGSNEG